MTIVMYVIFTLFNILQRSLSPLSFRKKNAFVSLGCSIGAWGTPHDLRISSLHCRGYCGLGILKREIILKCYNNSKKNKVILFRGLIINSS